MACSSDGTLRIVDVAACPQQQQQQQQQSNGGGNGGDGGGAIQALRAVHDLQYKSSLRRDRQRSAARRLMPLVELMAVSPDGR